jgi:uncharacterized membrane protein
MAKKFEDSHLSAQETALLADLRALDPARSATIAPPLSVSERLADLFATAIGSWRFLILETLLFAAWIMLNVAGWIANWDPYPFILLNLVLAIQAAYAGPIIMMSQKRQAAIDRHRSMSDYEINVKAALEIKLLHQKIDTIVEQEIPELRRTLARIEGRSKLPESGS